MVRGGRVQRSGVDRHEVVVVVAAAGAGGGRGVREAVGGRGREASESELARRGGVDARSDAAPLGDRRRCSARRGTSGISAPSSSSFFQELASGHCWMQFDEN
jgi:hypothetical protein